MSNIKLIEAMSNVCGTSGFESSVLYEAKKFIDKGLEIKTDNMLNAEIVPKGFDEEKPYIALDAHMDEVGMMIHHLKPNGLISVIMLGGWDLRNPLSQDYKIILNSGEGVKALVASIPPHFNKESKELKAEDILLDVGASSIEELENMGIEIGLPIVPNTVFTYDKNRKVMMGKAFDDRMGCSVLIAAINEAAKKGYKQIKAVLSTQEEVGLRGAGVVSHRLKAEKMICLEGGPADDTIYPEYEAQAVLGKGPQLRLIDRTSICQPEWIKHVRSIGDKNKIKYQVSVRRGGGTNMGMYQHTGLAIPTCVLAVPVRYIHTNCGIAKYEDFEACLDFTNAIVDDYFKK